MTRGWDSVVARLRSMRGAQWNAMLAHGVRTSARARAHAERAMAARTKRYHTPQSAAVLEPGVDGALRRLDPHCPRRNPYADTPADAPARGTRAVRAFRIRLPVILRSIVRVGGRRRSEGARGCG
jgi:hypothetical protein